MNAYTHSALLVAVMSATVITLRALPFLIFKGKKTPKFITYLGVYLPYAIMGMLVVYCLRNVSVTAAPHGLPELIAIIVTAGLQVWKKQGLLSILTGTVTYMLLVQLVF